MEPLTREQGWELFAAQIKTLIGGLTIFIGLLWIPMANGYLNFIPLDSLPQFVPAIEGTISHGEYIIVNLIMAWIIYWGLVTLLDGAVAWKKITGYKKDERSTVSLPRIDQTSFQ
jgi:hypothetical protein